MTRTRAMACALALIVTSVAAGQSTFENLGMGGAGGIFTPASSPVDPEFLLASSDMSGCYRSDDGGASWDMIHHLQIKSAHRCKPAFHPTDVNVVVWKGRISQDKARTFEPLVAGRAPWGEPTHNAIAGDHTIYVGSAAGIWVGREGEPFSRAADGPCGGITILPDDTVIAAAGDAVLRGPAGHALERVEIPSPGERIRAIAAGGTAAAHTIHALTESLHTSTDSGASWKETLIGAGRRDVVMSVDQTTVAWSSDRRRMYRTDDSGASWTSTFDWERNVEHSWVETERRWGYKIVENGINVNATRPELAMLTTQGEFYVTRDAGTSWRHLVNERVGDDPDARGGRYRSIGLEVTTTWDYLFDPFDADRHYIAYSDIGFARSTDRGKTWMNATWGSPWQNTFYGVAFDPFVKGRMYAAASNVHDIPHWQYSAPQYGAGGVVISNDHGASWTPVDDGGLPVRQACGIAVDKAASRRGATVLYVTVYGDGVYKSIDSGKSWTKKPGVGRPGNLHVYQVRVHEKTGHVFVNTTGNRRGKVFSPDGGLWRSTDGGDTWTELTATLRLGWPNGFVVHPDDPSIIYLTAGTWPGPGGDQGGVYKTTDGGANWRHVHDNADGPGYVQGMFIEMDPRDPDVLYFGGTRGLYTSADAGETWHLVEELPFSLIHRVRIDPRDGATMYVTGFGGGVWRGPSRIAVAGKK